MNLIDTVSSLFAGYLRDYDYRTDSNRLDTMKHQWGSSGTGTVETRLTYNVVGARATEKTQGPDWLATLGRAGVLGVQTDYSYSARLEVASSGKYPLAATWSLLEGENTSVLTATARDYTYDEIGNRTTDQDGSYTPNELNQYSATPGIASLSYDANGNLTGDGTRTYDYDAENRLTRVTEPGVRKSEYVYDYLGRRITKSVYTWNAGSQLWALNAQLKFLYDGWNLIAELSGSGTVIRTFVWGLDVSGTWQGAGGVGGLLIADAGGSPRYPIYDASHNVIGLYDGNGATVAAYEYDPFGNLQTTSLTADASSNPFRSATKYTDSETGLIYYGLRYYSPRLGRFIHRDPIEEQGGVNLYAFCGNDGVNRYDMLGMNFWDTIKSMLGIGQGSYQPSSPTREPPANKGPNGEEEGRTRTNPDGSTETYHQDGPLRDGAYYRDDDDYYSSWKASHDATVGYQNDQAMRNTAPNNAGKTYTPNITYGELVSLGVVGNDAISASTPSSPGGIDYNNMSADAYGAAWDSQFTQSRDQALLQAIGVSAGGQAGFGDSSANVALYGTAAGVALPVVVLGAEPAAFAIGTNGYIAAQQAAKILSFRVGIGLAGTGGAIGRAIQQGRWNQLNAIGMNTVSDRAARVALAAQRAAEAAAAAAKAAQGGFAPPTPPIP